MSPVLQEGDYIITARRRPVYGDVIVFEHPERPGFQLIKRVIGIAGQQVKIRDGTVLIDGRQIDEPWTADDSRPDGSWTVPDGCVFVLGDARHRSVDSRTLGPIAIGRTAQAAWLRYWPPSRISRLRNRRPAIG